MKDLHAGFVRLKKLTNLNRSCLLVYLSFLFAPSFPSPLVSRWWKWRISLSSLRIASASQPSTTPSMTTTISTYDDDDDDNDDTNNEIWHVYIITYLFVCRGNFLPTITDSYIKKCNFDMINNTYCPIFRVGDVVRYAQQNFTKLADKVRSKDILGFGGKFGSCDFTVFDLLIMGSQNTERVLFQRVRGEEKVRQCIKQSTACGHPWVLAVKSKLN